VIGEDAAAPGTKTKMHDQPVGDYLHILLATTSKSGVVKCHYVGFRQKEDI
jgi:hypothetical protein